MRKHRDPYRVDDPDNIFEVSENSSHPELMDAKRIWKFGAYTFNTATELQRFFESEGLNPRNYSMNCYTDKNVISGKHRIIVEIVEKWKARVNSHLREKRFNGAAG